MLAALLLLAAPVPSAQEEGDRVTIELFTPGADEAPAAAETSKWCLSLPPLVQSSRCRSVVMISGAGRGWHIVGTPSSRRVAGYASVYVLNFFGARKGVEFGVESSCTCLHLLFRVRLCCLRPSSAGERGRSGRQGWG